MHQAWVDRLARARALALSEGLDALLISPGPDLRYLVGYDAVPLERLTCLVVRPSSDPVLVVPRLEALAALASPAGALGIEIATWGETDDPYRLTASLVSGTAVAVDNHMWAEKVLRLRQAMPSVRQELAGPVMATLRMRKDAVEIQSLRAAAAAIDAVHGQVPDLLRPGRTEAQVGAEIADLILAAGHVAVDFVIVASGPNGASPHHEVSERVLRSGDCVVVDIGGTMPTGYRSDCTRTYALGQADERFLERYAVLLEAQLLSVAAVRPGVSCEAIDAAGRQHMARARMAELFIHRTGHGIGLETHEDPYIVAGNAMPLEVGMAFSVEPGFYVEGVHGARIEDIVVVTDDGAEVLNSVPRELVIAE